MKKILCISHKYPPSTGGMEKHCFELVKGLKKYYTVLTIVYTRDTNKLIWFTRLKSNIKKVLKANPDISLIYMNDGLVAAACSWLKSYSNIPLVATLHGLDITFPNQIYQSKIIPRLHQYDLCITVSKATKAVSIAKGIAKHKVVTIPNGVDHAISEISHSDNQWVENFHPNIAHNLKNKKLIVTMGRAVKRKGFSWFTENVMPDIMNDCVFIMMGPFNKYPTIIERILRLLPTKINSQIQLVIGFPSDEH